MNAQVEHDKIKGRYLSQYCEAEERLAGNGSSWLCPLRKQAIDSFAEQGFPTRRDEDWRQTNLSGLIDAQFETPGVVEVPQAIKPHLLEEIGGIRLVFVNGCFSAEFSTLANLPQGVIVANLSDAVSAQRNAVSEALGKHASLDGKPFVALNTAFMTDGAFIHIPENREIAEPIHLLYATTGGEISVSYPRNLIIAESGAKATILESYVGLEDAAYFTNSVTEAVIAPGAQIEQYKLQMESTQAYHIGSTQTWLGEEADYRNHSIAIGAALARCEVGAILGGERIECLLNGLYLGAGSQHIDTYTRVEHAKPNCNSHEHYKGILNERASAVFSGRILVKPDAQKTDAVQSNSALLLSDTATVNTQPQLEIFADDVKCTHGATIGQLDDESMFYLRSRGVPADKAKGILIFAFANDIVENIAIEPLRAKLERLIAERFQQEEALEESK